MRSHFRLEINLYSEPLYVNVHVSRQLPKLGPHFVNITCWDYDEVTQTLTICLLRRNKLRCSTVASGYIKFHTFISSKFSHFIVRWCWEQRHYREITFHWMGRIVESGEDNSITFSWQVIDTAIIFSSSAHWYMNCSLTSLFTVRLSFCAAIPIKLTFRIFVLIFTLYQTNEKSKFVTKKHLYLLDMVTEIHDDQF